MKLDRQSETQVASYYTHLFMLTTAMRMFKIFYIVTSSYTEYFPLIQESTKIPSDTNAFNIQSLGMGWKKGGFAGICTADFIMHSSIIRISELLCVYRLVG